LFAFHNYEHHNLEYDFALAEEYLDSLSTRSQREWAMSLMKDWIALLKDFDYDHDPEGVSNLVSTIPATLVEHLEYASSTKHDGSG